jgi:hypothetical protein
VTERDRWLLEALGKMRFLTTIQIARLGFNSRSAANKRLRTLFDQGLIRVWVRTLAADNVYSLDRQGRRILGEDGCALSVPRGLDGLLPHLLMIKDVRIAFVLGLAGAERELLWWRSDWELRAGRPGAAVPDALCSVAFNGTPKTFALEVEQSGKSPKKFLAKVLRYRSQRTRLRALYGVDEFALLVVGRDDQSVERYRQWFASLSHGIAWFTSLDEICSPGALRSIWRPAHGLERYSLQDLPNLP